MNIKCDNCNECNYINITEEEQHSKSLEVPHICTKYNKRVFHGNQLDGTYFKFAEGVN